MASPISTLSFCCSSSASNSKSTMYSMPSCSSSSTLPSSSCLKTLKFSLPSRLSQFGLCHFTPWSGLKHMGISISAKPQKLGSRAKSKGKVVYASLFGVGAPEALVIGVVALLVFGPKGLAEVARNLGKTLRAFQPTIRELQDVSREFKTALEREISLDDDPSSVNNTYGSNNANLTSSQSVSSSNESQTTAVADPNGVPPNNAYSSEEYLTVTEEQLKASAAAAWGVASPPLENQIEIDNQPHGFHFRLPNLSCSLIYSLRSVCSFNPFVRPLMQPYPFNVDGALPKAAYSTEEYLKITKEQLKAAAAAQQNALSSPSENQIETESQPQATSQETATATPQAQKPESEA